MNDSDGLGQELLRQNGLGSPGDNVDQWREIEKLLQRDQRRGRLLMGCCLGLLVLGVLSLLIAFSLAPLFDRPFRVPSVPPSPVSFAEELIGEGLPLIGMWCLGLSPVFAAAWFFYSRVADQKALRARLLSIELLLRRGSQGDSKNDQD